MKAVVIILLLLVVTSPTYSQIEHNFKMGPQKTDCHTLELSLDTAQNVELIRLRKFRVKEEFQISRSQVPNSLEFYSCDGEQGYIIAIESKSSTVLFRDINKSLWDSLLITEDPLSFYFEYLKKSN